eukprot:TRINITY_DN4178_c0_g1_i1.p1 TRINITY_DN4178_c0_g1~~TRINITY_DN4178_c0_g1_i1.p1  ORF type:complete len:527 (-),score=154.75 TRINITY_DN4178_c0_g1_i1:19-1599(-)
MHKVRISNLNKKTDEDRLSAVFCDIDFIKINVARTEKNVSKGYCHMELSCEKDLEKALQLNGIELDGRKLKVEKDEEEMYKINQDFYKTESKIQRLNEKIEKEKNQERKSDEQISDKVFHSYDKDISVALSTENCQLICELRQIFKEMEDLEFKHQIERNDELKKIYGNCCSLEKVTLEQKLSKINHLKFDDNPFRDEQLKILSCVLVKAFEDSEYIDFNICNKLQSNLKSVNSAPEKAIVFELGFSKEILGEHTFLEFSMDKWKQKLLEMTLQKKLGEILEVPFGEIVFLKIREGKVRFEGVIPSKILAKYIDKGVDVNDYINNVLKEKIRKGLSKIYPLKTVEVALQSFKSKLNLNPSDFDTKGDYYFDEENGKTYERGGLIYYQPSNQWRRYGLRVMGVYENDDWLKMDGNPNEWAIAFHGTSVCGERGIDSILKSRRTNIYAGKKSKNREDPIPDAGLCFAQNVEDCCKKPVELDGVKYEACFQCRIDPEHIWITEDRTFIVVDDPLYVRPYGIVLKNYNDV